MQAVSAVQKPRRHYRHELRTLTYVNLDEGNGGIVRNLNCDGVAVQAVAALREQQPVRLHFELRFPRVRVEARGLVSWATASGQCGIRFVDLPQRTAQSINDWIFSNLLERAAREFTGPVAALAAPFQGEQGENAPAVASRLAPSFARLPAISAESSDAILGKFSAQSVGQAFVRLFRIAQSRLQSISRPISVRTLGWLIDSLVMLAALLLFALVFLAIAHELPPWPLTLTTILAVMFFVPSAYWALFAILGGPSVGVRLTEYGSGEGRKEPEEINLR